MKEVIVTTSWDDGHKLDLKLAKLLKKYNIKGTFYISPKDHEFNFEQLLTATDIKEISNNFEIGAHTMTHPHLSRIKLEEAEEEIAESKIFLEKTIDKEITSFCYPYGDYNEHVITIAKKNKFTLARTVKRFSLNIGKSFELKTTVHTYNHFSDIFNLLRITKWNIKKLIRYRNWELLAKDLFDKAYENGGTFHLWGHSWEIEKNNDWEKLERVLSYISGKNNVVYKENKELVSTSEMIQKKLLLVTPYFYPRTGGLENYAFNIAKGLTKDYKMRVVVVTSNHESKENISETVDGIKVYRLAKLFKISNTPINPKWYFDIKNIINVENPDIINAHAPVPFIADVSAVTAGNIPFVLTYHAGTMKKKKFFFDLIIGLYENIFLQFMFKKSSKIICSSDFVRKTIAQKYLEKSEVITPGVDLSLFKPSQIKKERNTVLFVGRYANMYALKGLKYLIDAVKEMPQVTLKIIGEKAVIKEKNIKFLGIKSGNELVTEIQKSNVLVLPSLAHMESFGMVLIEAMACKTSVIGTNIGGIPEIIQNRKTGLLIPPKDVHALQTAILTILTDKVSREKMVKEAYKNIKNNFTWDTQVKKTYQILTNI